MRRLIPVALLALAAAGCPGGGGGERRSAITVKGSDTMVILGQRWAETYMHKRLGAMVQVTGGGSGTGIAALINGGTDICQASRPMKEKEREELKRKRGAEAKEIPVALDALAIYVHGSSRLEEIAIPRVRAIYTGKLTSWKEIGGEDQPIVAYSRENSSGTYLYFKEHVLENRSFAPEIQTLPGTAAVINAVTKDPRSIGYGGIAYARGIKALKVSRTEGEKAVFPSLASVHDGSYPISRSLFFYTAGEPEGDVKAFIEWALGEEGQKVCEEVGYYPLPRRP